jgi:hypothetical protein
MVQPATCAPNTDTLVRFDVTIARDARQGFFDVAVAFEDLFCSAKLDCQAGNLLFDGANRASTMVLGFACTAGPKAAGDTSPDDTWLYLSDLTVTCATGTATVDPSDGPGLLATNDIISTGQSPLFSAATYRGEESLSGIDKHYWNVALGWRGGNTCVLEATGTASAGPLESGTTPAGVYPYLRWRVTLTNGSGGLLCDSVPLNTASCPAEGACVLYTTTGPMSFAHAYHANGGAPDPVCTPACVNGTCELGNLCDCDPGWSGASCATDTDGCLAAPCFPGVTCTDLAAPQEGRTCGPCPFDFAGDGINCTAIDQCSPNPCLNGGSCTDGLGTFTCDCTGTNHTGTTCETPLDVNGSNVTLLLHGEGADNTATFTDSSSYNHAISRQGNTVVSHAQKAFGTGSLYFDGAGDLLVTPTHPGFAFGTGAFTVETWYRRTSRVHPYPRIWQFGPINTSGWNTNQHWALADGHQVFAPTKFVLHVFARAGNASAFLVSQSDIQANRWYHLAVTRSGDTWRLFVDGVMEASGTWNGAPDNGVSNNFALGGANYANDDFVNGHLDEVRITKGVARYTANFTPPTAPFPNP